ncbi:MAG: hypothetical protein M1821_008018 [Bathelium mastoideum]|nr:MAG: hypothetical protein M1821_008018 [Bathelium mastoideum]
MQNTAEDISHAATGHKANLSNPNTSEASKENSRQALKELGGEDAFYGKSYEDPNKNPGNVAGGLKAAINNPEDNEHKVTDEGKQQAKEKLQNVES